MSSDILLKFAGLEDTKSRTDVARNLQNTIDPPKYKWTKEAPSRTNHLLPVVTAMAALSLVTLMFALLAWVSLLWRCVLLHCSKKAVASYCQLVFLLVQAGCMRHLLWRTEVKRAIVFTYFCLFSFFFFYAS